MYLCSPLIEVLDCRMRREKKYFKKYLVDWERVCSFAAPKRKGIVH
jgi:hypothetical protein